MTQLKKHFVKLAAVGLFLLSMAALAGPPSTIRLTWNAPVPSSYVATNFNTGQVFTNQVVAYRLYSSTSLEVPVDTWPLAATVAVPSTIVVVPFSPGTKFYVVTAMWSTNGSSDTFYLSPESDFSNVAATHKPSSGDSLKARPAP